MPCPRIRRRLLHLLREDLLPASRQAAPSEGGGRCRTPLRLSTSLFARFQTQQVQRAPPSMMTATGRRVDEPPASSHPVRVLIRGSLAEHSWRTLQSWMRWITWTSWSPWVCNKGERRFTSALENDPDAIIEALEHSPLGSITERIQFFVSAPRRGRTKNFCCLGCQHHLGARHRQWSSAFFRPWTRSSKRLELDAELAHQVLSFVVLVDGFVQCEPSSTASYRCFDIPIQRNRNCNGPSCRCRHSRDFVTRHWWLSLNAASATSPAESLSLRL